MKLLRSIFQQLFDPSDADLKWVNDIDLDDIQRWETFALSLVLATRSETPEDLPTVLKRLNHKNRIKHQLRKSFLKEINSTLIAAELDALEVVGNLAFSEKYDLPLPNKNLKAVSRQSSASLLSALNKWHPLDRTDRIIIKTSATDRCIIFLTDEAQPYPAHFLDRLLWKKEPKIVSACCFGLHLLQSGKEKIPQHLQDRVTELLEFLLSIKCFPNWMEQIKELRPSYNGLYRDALAKICYDDQLSSQIDHQWYNRLASDQLAHLLPNGTLPKGLKGTIRERKINQLAMINEVGQLQKKFATAGLEVIHYKGPIWSHQQTGNLGSRQFHDLDILASIADLQAIDNILEGHGYSPKYPKGAISMWKSSSIDRELSYFKKDQQGKHLFHFEVHPAVAPYEYQFGLGYEFLLPHTEIIEVNGLSYRILSSEMSILVAAVSFAKDGWQSPKQVLDIHRFAQTSTTNWSLLLEKSNKKHLLHYLLIALGTSQRLFHTVLPADIELRIETHRETIKNLLEQIERRHTTDPFIIRNARESRKRKKSMALANLIAQLAPNHADQQYWRYLPNRKAFLPLYALLKPLRIALDGKNNDDDFRPWADTSTN